MNKIKIIIDGHSNNDILFLPAIEYVALERILKRITRIRKLHNGKVFKSFMQLKI